MRLVSIICFIFLLPSALFAQNQVDYGMFVNAAQDRSILFRGEYPMRFGNWLPQDGSTSYAYSTNFEKGNVLFYGKLYKDIELNLNAYRDELYIKDPHGSLSVANKNYVESFSLGARLFVHVTQDDGVLQNGFYQILYSGKHTVYKKIRKLYYEKPGDGGRLKRGFKLLEHFYVQKDNQWYRISAKADVKKLLGEQKKAMDHLVKTRNLNFRNDKEQFLVGIFTYVDQL